ncbi:hypothetical protein EV424DRAFT_1348396 [Suillus variegatus]|nr:hypothetical protein EV424DRAFT_1348396 [Suillus variegatus]
MAPPKWTSVEQEAWLQPWKARWAWLVTARKAEQEAYSKLFYATRVQPTVQGSLKAVQEHRTLTNGERVALVKKETAVLYAQESADIKDQVKQYLEDQKQQRLQNKLEGTDNLDKLAAVANSFLKGLTEATRDIVLPPCWGFHVGQTKLGNNFSTAYPEFDRGVMEPFRDFLHRVHPEASISRPQESSSETGGLSTSDSNDLDIYGSGSKLLSFLDVSESGTSGSVPDPLSTGDASLWSDVQSAPREPNRSLDQFLQTPILPEPLTTTPSYGDDWTTPDLDVFLSNLDVQMGLGPLAGASEIATLTMPTLPLASPPGTSTPPPDTSLSIPPAISHSPQRALTMPTLPPDTSLNVPSTISRTPQLALTMPTFLPAPASPPGTTSPPDTGLSIPPAISHTSQWTETPSTSELLPASTTHSLDVAPTLGNECLDELDVNTDKDRPALETRRTKHIPKPSTRNDTANVIGCPRKENKRPRALAETSSGHGSNNNSGNTIQNTSTSLQRSVQSTLSKEIQSLTTINVVTYSVRDKWFGSYLMRGMQWLLKILDTIRDPPVDGPANGKIQSMEADAEEQTIGPTGGGKGQRVNNFHVWYPTPHIYDFATKGYIQFGQWMRKQEDVSGFLANIWAVKGARDGADDFGTGRSMNMFTIEHLVVEFPGMILKELRGKPTVYGCRLES